MEAEVPPRQAKAEKGRARPVANGVSIPFSLDGSLFSIVHFYEN